MQVAPLAIGLGVQELAIILVILVLLFGAKRIPELAKGLGQGIRGFKGALKGDDEEADGPVHRNES